MQALSHRHARRHAWLWLAVFVLALLAPGLSAALAQARGDYAAFQDICSANPARAATQAEPGGAALKVLTQGHCPACHLGQAAAAPPPPAPATPALRNDLAFSAPERFWSAPHTAHAWASAPARAPPASS